MTEWSTSEKQREWSRTYRENHREEILHRRRLQHAERKEEVNAKRREKYHANVAQGIKKLEPKRMCPLCNIDYTRKHLKTHLLNRHKCSEEELQNILFDSVKEE